MSLVKCPRCELNYMNDQDKYCKVCLREIHGEVPKEETEMCTVCNDVPALPGKDVCLFCLKEMDSHNKKEEETTPGNGHVELDDVSTMDEIIPDVEEDIHDEEYQEMNNHLSLDEMEEEENRDEDDSEEDDM